MKNSGYLLGIQQTLIHFIYKSVTTGRIMLQSSFMHVYYLKDSCMITTLVKSQVLKCMISDSRATVFFSIVLLHEVLCWWRPHSIPLCQPLWWVKEFGRNLRSKQRKFKNHNQTEPGHLGNSRGICCPINKVSLIDKKAMKNKVRPIIMSWVPDLYKNMIILGWPKKTHEIDLWNLALSLKLTECILLVIRCNQQLN